MRPHLWRIALGRPTWQRALLKERHFLLIRERFVGKDSDGAEMRGIELCKHCLTISPVDRLLHFQK